jgi:hypothetical protein
MVCKNLFLLSRNFLHLFTSNCSMYYLWRVHILHFIVIVMTTSVNIGDWPMFYLDWLIKIVVYCQVNSISAMFMTETRFTINHVS